MLPVAILAGGLATRLRPITESIPKALVDVAGQPFVCHQLQWLRKQGAQKAVLCLGYRAGQIQDLVGDGRRFGLDVEYSLDGERLLGTGGALRKALPKLGESFFVLYGDSYLTCSLADVERAYVASRQPALMTVFSNDGQWDRSNVLFKDRRVVRYDKRNPLPEMRYIDYGLSVLSAGVVNQLELDQPFDLADALTDLSAQGKLAGYEVAERFYEVGTHEGLRDMQAYLSRMNGR